MSTSLSIKGKTQANDGVTSTINYVNPNATNAQLQSLASAMNALTTNTITDVTRIDKNSLTAAVTKLPRNAYLTLENGSSDPVTTIRSSDIGTTLQTTLQLNIHYDDQAGEYEEISIGKTGSSVEYYITWMARTGDEEYNEGMISFLRGSQDLTAETIKIYIPEDSTYQAATITLTITAE